MRKNIQDKSKNAPKNYYVISGAMAFIFSLIFTDGNEKFFSTQDGSVGFAFFEFLFTCVLFFFIIKWLLQKILN